MPEPVLPAARLRVALVAGTLEVGGAERQLVRVAIELHRRGHDVRMLALLGGGPLAADLADAGVPTFVAGLERQHRGSAARAVLRLGAAYRFLLAGRPDVVHARLTTAALFTVPVARLAGVPVTVTNRVGAWPPPSLRRPLHWRLNALTNRCTSRVLAGSEALAEVAARAEGVPATRLRVVANGVDLAGVRAAPEVQPPTAMVVANLRPVKGHADLIAALAQMDDPPMTHLVGDGPERHALEAQVAAAGLAGRIVFEGSVQNGAARFGDAQLAVLPSHSEGTPNAVLEAMAAGLPTVATAVGGVPELIVDGETGILVPPRDPEALAAAIERLAADPSLRTRMGVAARTAAHAWSWPSVVDAREQIYTEALAETARGRRRLRRARRTAQRGGVRLVIGSLQPGGAERQLVRLATELHGRGRVVDVVVVGRDGPLSADLRAAGVPYACAGFEGVALRHPMRTGRGLARVWTSLLRGRPQILDARLPWAYMLAMPAGLLARVPVRIAGRRAEFSDYRPSRRWHRWLHQLSARCSSAIVANSARVAEAVPDHEGVEPARVHVIANGLDLPTESAHPERTPPVVVMVASLRPVKAHDVFLRALALLEPVPQVRLIGDGPERGRLEALVAELGLGDAVTFEGAVRDGARCFLDAQIAVLSSRSEGLPGVVLEAMGAGLPVVATAVGGVTELVEDQTTGLLVPPDDPAALAAALAELLADPERRAAMGATARTRAEAFSWERCVQAHEALYDSLCAASGRPR